jgi:hypothetical protein
MNRIRFSALLVFILTNCFVSAQPKNEQPSDIDRKALEGIIVEKYYVSDSADYSDSLGGVLQPGSITYRIYVDLKPNYTLQAIYGDPKHELRIQTTTKFYNNTYCGALIGYNVNRLKINDGNYALDSWITINSACNYYAGILLSEDKDSSIISKKAFEKADGFTNGNLPYIKPFNIEFNCFSDASNAYLFTTSNGGWAGLSGIKSGAKGPTEANKILIAQLTTTGKISFELNIQVGTPAGGVVKYVAKNPEGVEVKFDGLFYSQDESLGKIHK